VACATDAGGQRQCRDGGPAPPFDQEVASGVKAMDQLVQGSGATYAVADTGNLCFWLRLRRTGLAAAPYGEQAQLCFDPATDAPVRTEIRRAEGTDLTVATSVRAVVSDDDLAVVPGR
jgi:hypothetical protein